MSKVKAKGIVGAVSLVAFAAVLSRLLGYVREVLLAAKFGASYVTDAFLLAQEIPGAIYFVVSASLVLAFIPVYREVAERRGEAAAWRLVNSALNLAMLLFVGLWVIGELTAPLFIPKLAPGLAASALELASQLTRAMLPLLLIVGMSGLSAAVLNANRHFAAPAFFGLASNVVVVASLFVVTRPEQIGWVAYAVVAGALLGTLIQVASLRRIGFRYQAVIDLGDPALLRVWLLLLPVIVATSVTQVQTFAARFVASHLAEGTISFLNYASRISALPFSVVGMAVSTVIFPTLAEHGAAGQMEEMKGTLRNGLRSLAFLLVPMAVGCALFAEPITRIMFERGAFTADDTRMTAEALRYFSLGILFAGWIDMLNRAFYALQDSLTPMLMALVMIGLNIGLNFLLVDHLGHGGLALSAGLAPLVGSLLLLWRLGKRLGPVGGRELAGALLSYLGTSLAGGLLGWLLYQVGSRALGGGGLVQLALLFLALALLLGTHLAVAIIRRTPDGEEIRRFIQRVLGKRRVA